MLPTRLLATLSLALVVQGGFAPPAAANRTLTILSAKGRKLVAPVYDGKARALGAGALLKATRTNKNNTKETRSYLSLQQYQEVRDGALELMQSYPPESHYYLGIGRSPTPIIAFLQNLGPKLASSMPVSGFKSRNNVAPPVARLDAAWVAHLDKFLPNALLERLEKEGRTILLVDRAVTGSSLSSVAGLVTQYLAKKGRRIAVTPVAFTSRQVAIARIDITNNAELQDMNHYEPWSEWPSHQVGVDSGTPKRRGKYDEFKDTMLERMKRDPALQF